MLKELFEDRERNKQMRKELSDTLEQERVEKEILDYFSAYICKQTGMDNIVDAWKQYKNK